VIPRRLLEVFRQGSRTYFVSSLFFPVRVREDVVRLYAFVRSADDFVDRLPQDGAGLESFEARYRQALAGRPAGDLVVDCYVDLAVRRGFDPAWTDAFFQAMRADLEVTAYRTLTDVERYMHGSAEVIGLMMARILDLDEAAYHSARLLGKAMQYVNFLRDIAEDQRLGRTYIPAESLHRHGLTSLAPDEVWAHPDRFAALVRAELARYRDWQRQAALGYVHLPPRVRVPVQTAADMYWWTAEQIEREPIRVFRRKVKPSVARITSRAARNGLVAFLPLSARVDAASAEPTSPCVGNDVR
jgi:15-cis-phytoene synthase